MRPAKKRRVATAERLIVANDRQPGTGTFEAAVNMRRAELLGGKEFSRNW
jgi:hypothetical protein